VQRAGIHRKDADLAGRSARHFLAAPRPDILNVFIDPSELPLMPHIKLEQIWHFGMAKIKEAMISMGGGG